MQPGGAGRDGAPARSAARRRARSARTGRPARQRSGRGRCSHGEVGEQAEDREAAQGQRVLQPPGAPVDAPTAQVPLRDAHGVSVPESGASAWRRPVPVRSGPGCPSSPRVTSRTSQPTARQEAPQQPPGRVVTVVQPGDHRRDRGHREDQGDERGERSAPVGEDEQHAWRGRRCPVGWRTAARRSATGSRPAPRRPARAGRSGARSAATSRCSATGRWLRTGAVRSPADGLAAAGLQGALRGGQHGTTSRPKPDVARMRPPVTAAAGQLVDRHR